MEGEISGIIFEEKKIKVKKKKMKWKEERKNGRWDLCLFVAAPH